MAEVSSQTLHIVARELTSELNEARAALEMFGEQQENLPLLRKCAEHLHCVHGALRIAEVYGAALLAEEMGQVTRYLIENFAEKRHLAEGLDALMRAMVQLPTYLERVLSGGRDMALVLLPLLNDLRAVRGHALLSEGTLLLLNLSSDQQANPVPAAPGEGGLTVAQWARKLRTRFQLGLLGWIKGERVDQNLEVLSRTAEKMEQIATTQPLFQLWWVVGAVLEALRQGGLEGTASVKRLLGQADRDLKRLYEQGEARYADSPSLELLNNLLYYVARSRSAGPRVAAVRASFRLSELLPVDDRVEQARESLSAPSVKLMKTVAAAIKEDLGRVKDALDIFVRQGGTQVDELAPQLDLLKKIADTLGVLGLGELRDKVQTETTDLQAIVLQRAPVDETTLLRMAATLIKVEDSLDEQLVGMIVPTDEPAPAAKPTTSDDVEFRQVTEAVLRECIVNMARIKEAIALSMEKPREAQAIEQIPPLVRGITAGLLMLNKPRVVEVMNGIEGALQQFVRSDGLMLPPEAVDRLADAIVAVEYYMETLQAGRTDPWYMLDNAETCLRYLADTQLVPRIEGLAAHGDHVRTVVIEPLSQTVAAPTEHEHTAVLDRQPGTPAIAQVSPEPVPVAASPGVAPTPMAPIDGPIDPEFLELFIEEAKDEIAKLQQYFPRWDENPQDHESLTNVRRSFHTLKGSGRMVGAQLIGEFSWAIENLLNRVINKTLERTPDIMTLLREAVAAVPELVEQLETGRDPRIDVVKTITQAHMLAGGRPAGAPVPGASYSPPRANAVPTAAASVAAEPPTLTAASIVEPIDMHFPEKKTASAPLIEAATDAPAPSTAPAMDPVLHEIYAKETAGHLAVIREFIASCELIGAPYPITEDLYRSCHTLSGTAKTAGARHGIKVAEPLNRYIRKLYDNSVSLPEQGLEVLKEAVNAIQQVIDHNDADTGFFASHQRIASRLNELDHALDAEISRLGETPDVGVIELDPIDASALELSWSFDNLPKESDATRAVENEVAAQPPGEEIDLDEFSVDVPLEAADGVQDGESTVTQRALGAFAEPADEVQTVKGLKFVAVDNDSLPVVDEAMLERAFADMPADDAAPESTNIQPALAEEVVLEAAADEETAVESEPESMLVVEEPVSEPMAPAVTTPESIASESMAPEPMISGPIASEPAADDASEVDDDFDPDVAAIFTEEATELLETAETSLGSWLRDRNNSSLVFELKRVIHTLKGGARMAGLRAMGDLSHELETLMGMIEAGQVPAEPQVFDVLQASLDELHSMRDVVANGGRCKQAKQLLSRIRALSGHGAADESLAVAPQAHIEAVMPAPEPAVAPVAQAADAEIHLSIDAGSEDASPTASVPTLTDSVLRDIAQGVVTILPEESQVDAVDGESAAEIEVEFGADELGAAAPRASLGLEDSQKITVEPPQTAFDVAALAPELPPDTPSTSTPTEPPIELAAEPQPIPALPPGREPIAQERQEFARVDADLLDTLLNNAGEVSIFRSRLEQQVSSIEFNLAELGRTVTRLKEQLRKIELETEAQILHRHQEEHPGRTDFDPLELDRYSTIQQLTRAFAESVSDVGSIEGLLENLTREAQNLLLQQSRVVTELQNGLMRTRMVPFQRHVQRLSRLVRQVASETNKKAELVVTGASGELDRQVLERMLPPFEHMLRNSVVHGIETPQEREAAGKPEVGTIKVGLHREGSEMVIVLEDDGRGIDVNAVRERARQRGLMQPGRVLTDEEAMQLIMEPGFSTAEKLTQHAGRGVGMDVVVTEIKKLGGALFTESVLGKGVKFTIRLPFTLAITQALIVRTGEELYALPLPTVEGVARIARSEVQKHLAEETPTFNYGGQIYRFQNLGAFIGGGPSVLPEADIAVPLVLIRAGEHSTALVTDELIGSREMVVKSVGPQIAAIRGIAGATILGDGRIVIILDMGALVRSEWRSRQQLEQGPAIDRRVFALVVDDSITVRRVTQRLLERHGMRVMTAKDGVDALSILQEHTPDVILLDIEMPRMDGYELAAHVRADARLAEIPIVMITSRVGEKHRARAIEIGVNDYLGKPYQENQLLDAIEPLVEARRRRVS